jgi:hypothetical protein
MMLLSVACLGLWILPARAQAQGPTNPDSGTSSSPVRKSTAPGDRVILKVGDVQVTQEQFESGFFNVGKQGDPDENAGLPSEKDRRTLGENYASALALSQRAIAEHLDQTPEIRRTLAMDRIQILSDAEYAKLMEQAKPSSEEISQYYSAHPSEYDQVLIRRLFIWKQYEGSQGRGVNPQAAKARADQVRQALASGTDPQKIADDLNHSGEGLLDPQPISFPRGELRPQMEKVAFGLKPDEWAQVEDTPASLILVQLIKHSVRDLPEVASLIEGQLQGRKMQTMLESLKEKAGIWMDKEYFATAGAPASGAQTHVPSPPTERQSQ